MTILNRAMRNIVHISLWEETKTGIMDVLFGEGVHFISK
jgi:hypothetical protein